MEKAIKTLAELDGEAERFSKKLTPKENGATLVTLSGELGAGKTAFVKAIARSLGIEETITSPTFVLEKRYQLGSSTSKFKQLVHIDAYRLESGADLVPLSLGELLRDTGNLVLLEWPERVQDVLPEPDVRMSLRALPDGSRALSYD